MSKPPIGHSASDDPFEKMRIRPAGQPDQGNTAEDPFEKMRIRPAGPDEGGPQAPSNPYGAPAQPPQQGFPQQQGFAQSAPNPYSQPQAPNPYAQQQAADPYAQQGFAQQQGFPQPAPNPYAQQQAPNPYGQQAPNPYGQQAAAALPEGSGQIAFDTGFFWLAWILFFTGPSVKIDGVEWARTWGKALVPVPPGQHLVEIHTRYLWPMGRASLPVFVQPGQTVPVFYQAPTIVWLKGAIGHEPQKAPGLILTMVIMAVAMLFACLIPIASIALSGY